MLSGDQPNVDERERKPSLRDICSSLGMRENFFGCMISKRGMLGFFEMLFLSCALTVVYSRGGFYK